MAGVIGSPQQVGGSLSPAIHNAAFEALGMDWVYLALGIDEGVLSKGIQALGAAGVRGLNVTMPHKVAVLGSMDRLSEDSAQIGAVNTIEFTKDGMVGHNTDGKGLVRFLRSDVGAPIEGARILILGAGGSARAVIHAFGASGASEIVVAARKSHHSAELALLAGPAEFRMLALDGAGTEVRSAVGLADVIVNATPVGQRGEPSIIPVSAIGQDCVVVDLVYRPPVTALIEGARAQGAIAHSGLGMLLHQAALSFEIWTGVEPPLNIMSSAALACLHRPNH